MSRIECKYERSPLFSLISVRFGSCEVRRLNRELVTFNKLVGESRYHQQNELLHICLLNNKNSKWKRYCFQRWHHFNIIRLSKAGLGSWFGYRPPSSPTIFFCKKMPLSQRVGHVMGGWMSGWEMYVCHTNQIGCTVKHQSNFLL